MSARLSPELEKEIEKKIGDYAKKRGCLYYKFASPSTRGVPDRIIIAPNGEIGFLEIKAKGKKPTPLQQRHIDTLIMSGCRATWTDNVLDGKVLIDRLCGALQS